MDAFVEERPAPPRAGSTYQLRRNVGVEPVEVPVADAEQHEPAERAGLDQPSQLVIRRIETLGEALHEDDPGFGDDARDAVAICQSGGERLLAEDVTAAPGGGLDERARAGPSRR